MITVGSILNDRYRLDRPLGRGGFAAVFLATDLRLRREVAVKVLDPALLADPDDTTAFFARFEREAQLVAALDHPNILGVHDYGEVDGTAYLVMPYIAGGTLYDRLRRDATAGITARLDPALALRFIEQAAAALDYAHAQGLVHRDIKPQNMLLRAEDDRLLLADFGIARVLDATGVQSRTAATGTLSYMAPEQLEGRATSATDIYALGCTLYQLLTGQVPFSGSTEQVMFAHLTAPIPGLAAHAPELSPALQPVIERALAKRPTDRYPTAGHLAATFAAALHERPTAKIATPPPFNLPTEATRPLVAADATATPPPTAVLPTPQGRTARTATPAPAGPNRRLLVGGLAVAGVLVLALILMGVLRGRAAFEAATNSLATATSGRGVASAGATRTAVTATRTPIPSGGAIATITGDPDTLRWSPNGAILAVAVPDQQAIALWNTGGTKIATITGHTDDIEDFAWSPDGAVLATASSDETIRLWSPTGEPLATLPNSGGVYRIAWQPGGRVLAAQVSSSVVIWSADGRPIAAIRSGDAFVWSPNGGLLAIGRGTDVELWSPDGQRRQTLSGHIGSIERIAWTRDGGKLAVTSNKAVNLWSADGQALGTIQGLTQNVQQIAWSPDGATLATDGPDGAVRLYGANGQLRTTLAGLEGDAHTIAWSPDGGAILGVSYNGAQLWAPDGRTLAVLSGSSTAVWSVKAPLLATNGCNCAAQLWGGDGQPRGNLGDRTPAADTLAFSPDASLLAVGTGEDTIRLFRVP